MKKSILVVVTSTAKYPAMNRPTGLWLGEAVHFVEQVEAAGYGVDFVSPQGGYTPIDPASLGEMALPIDWEYYQNPQFMARLGATMRPEQIDPDLYAAIYFAGGHGVIWDFPDNVTLQRISAQIYASGGIVASVCHGAVGLLNIKLSDESSLIAGKIVTGFSNEEERLAKLDEHVPFLTEDELKLRGAIYRQADHPFTEFAVADGRLVTGQNPQSGAAVAKKVLAVLAGSGN
ncbi:MAG: type 1 glutamine amidotransferase domain-containing protein [Pirellulales bacterium]|nr:type 1 glutamine amidotransferase domain-containing protein [Pirellulales bacterium]